MQPQHHQQPSFRVERINELIKRELVGLIKQQINDPRLQDLIITEIITSRDLKNAKVFYSIKNPDQKITKILKSAAGFLRKRLSKHLNLRHTPELKFFYDESPNTAARIEKLLQKL